MKMNPSARIFLVLAGLLLILSPGQVTAQWPEASTDLDRKVLTFLKNQAGEWRDMNVPGSDGRILYDLVLA
ncbi:MAG: hypothetical protein WBI19_01840, partial [Prolixibacteraceae bacterium]